MRGLDLARRIPTGIVHINDQTVDDAPNTPFGGVLASGTGARFGGDRQPRRVHRHAAGSPSGRDRPLPVLTARRSHEDPGRHRRRLSPAAAAAVPSAGASAASTRWWWRTAAGPTARPGSGPGCWRTARSSCCAKPGLAQRPTGPPRAGARRHLPAVRRGAPPPGLPRPHRRPHGHHLRPDRGGQDLIARRPGRRAGRWSSRSAAPRW